MSMLHNDDLLGDIDNDESYYEYNLFEEYPIQDTGEDNDGVLNVSSNLNTDVGMEPTSISPEINSEINIDQSVPARFFPLSPLFPFFSFPPMNTLKDTKNTKPSTESTPPQTEKEQQDKEAIQARKYNAKDKIKVEDGKTIQYSTYIQRKYKNTQTGKILTRDELRAAEFDEEKQCLIYNNQECILEKHQHQNSRSKSTPMSTLKDTENTRPSTESTPPQIEKEEANQARKYNARDKIKVEGGKTILYRSYIQRIYVNIPTGEILDRDDLRAARFDEEKQCLIYDNQEYVLEKRQHQNSRSRSIRKVVEEFLNRQSPDLKDLITSTNPEKIRVGNLQEITWRGFMSRQYQNKKSGESLTKEQMRQAIFNKDFNLVFEGQIFSWNSIMDHSPKKNPVPQPKNSYSPKLFATEKGRASHKRSGEPLESERPKKQKHGIG
jgi:hypothetical protein